MAGESTKVYRPQGGESLIVQAGGKTGIAESGLWSDCPLWEYMHDPTSGILLCENWNSYNDTATTGDYVTTQATTGTAAKDTAVEGVLLLDSNSTTATQGVQIQRAKTMVIPKAGSNIWMEFILKIVDTFDKAEIFAGLSEIDTTIIATSANSSANHIGWQCVTDDGVLLFSAEKAGTGATKAAATIAEATNIQLGFKVTGVTQIEQYINGVLTGTAHATANIPIVALYPSFVCQTGGTNDPIMHLQSYRVFQTRA